MEALTKRLLDLRIENGYTQEEVAKELNMTTSAYGDYEQGINGPSLEMFLKIARFYQVSPDYLVGRSDIRYQSVYRMEGQVPRPSSIPIECDQ